MNPSIHRFCHTSSTDSVELNSVRTNSDLPAPQPAASNYSNSLPVRPGDSPSELNFLLGSLRERIAINQVTTFPWCLTQDLSEYRQWNIPGIGLNWRKLTEFGMRRAMRQVIHSQLQVSSLGCVGGFTGENGYSIKEVLADARKIIRVAGQLRAGTVTIVTGALAGHIRSHANRIVVESLKELVPLAALYGVQLALQPMHAMYARNWSFIHSLDETLMILDRVQDSRLKISFGTYHLWPEQDLASRLPELAPRIGLVRLADWGDAPRHEHDRLLPGAGRLPLSALIKTLEQNRYSGWYELEVWSRDLWKQDRRDLMQACVSARDSLCSSLITV